MVTSDILGAGEKYLRASVMLEPAAQRTRWLNTYVAPGFVSSVDAEMSRAGPNDRPVVLVVEDEGLIRATAEDLVLAAGFQVASASNVDEAIRILESRDDIQAVFTDVQMPGSVDGLKLVRIIRDHWPPVALLVTSG